MKKLLFFIIFVLSITILAVSCGKTNKTIEKQAKKNLMYGNVIRVYDGDTLTLEGNIKIRLYGIDAPELKQKGGKLSRSFLYNKVYGKKIAFEEMSTDRYGRIVAKIYLKDEYINRYMLENGAAWWYEEYAPNDTDLKEAFQNAKKNRVGIFKDYNIKNPADYRKENKKQN